jgi:hypothetical protein
MSTSGGDMRFSETWLVFRERPDGTWSLMDETTIASNRSLRGQDSSELVIRGFMGRSDNHGGKFAAVKKDEWRLLKAQKQSPVVEKVA